MASREVDRRKKAPFSVSRNGDITDRSDAASPSLNIDLDGVSNSSIKKKPNSHRKQRRNI